MVKLNLGEIEFDTKFDIINTLNEIADAIENDYKCGVTIGGVCWDIEGEEEPEEEYEFEE
jgi:hypothetical protein